MEAAMSEKLPLVVIKNSSGETMFKWVAANQSQADGWVSIMDRMLANRPGSNLYVSTMQSDQTQHPDDAPDQHEVIAELFARSSAS
jgi:hypothetical protein